MDLFYMEPLILLFHCLTQMDPQIAQMLKLPKWNKKQILKNKPYKLGSKA